MSDRARILVIGHDGGRQGAPRVLLDLLTWMSEHTRIRFDVILHHDGPLRSAYQRLAPTTVLNPHVGSRRTVARVLRRVLSPGRLDEILGWRLRRSVRRSTIDAVWINSVAAWRAAELVAPAEVPRILHVHELEYAIERVGPPPGKLAFQANDFIAASAAVRDNLVRRHQVASERITVVYSSVPKRTVAELSERQKCAARERLGIGDEAFVVVGCGAVCTRKGVDLLPSLIGALRRDHGLGSAVVMWIGAAGGDLKPVVEAECGKMGFEGAVRFVGEVEDPLPLMALGDVFALPSREEPLGLVCLEAAQCLLPTVCFLGSGGAPEFVGENAGIAVPHLDVAAMAAAIADLGTNREKRLRLAARARRRVDEVFTIDRQAPVLERVFRRVLDRGRQTLR